MMLDDCAKKSADVEETAAAITEELTSGMFVDVDMIQN